MKLVSIKYTNFKPDHIINDYLEEKLGPLEKYVENFGTPHDLRIELAKTTKHHKTGPYFYAEANINIPGKMFRIEETAEDLYGAIDLLKDEIERQLSDYSDKLRTENRKGGRKAKNMLH